MNTRISRGATACALLASTALCVPSIARAALPAPKFVDSIDDHGVDLATGLPFVSIEEGGIGSGPGRVAMQRIWSEGAGWLDNWSGGLFVRGGKTYVEIAGISETFSKSGTVYTNEKANGATLVTVSGGNLLFTASDGTKINFYPANQNALAYSCPGADPATCQIPTDITRPNGLKFHLTWVAWRQCLTPPAPGESCTDTQIFQRLQSVSSSAGYSLTIAYAASTPPGTYVNSAPPADWFRRTGVTFDNSASHPSPVPAIIYGAPTSNSVSVTDPAGRTWRFTTDSSGRLTGVRRPGSAADNIVYAYGTDGTVSSSTKDGVTNSYGRSIAGSVATETLTNPQSKQVIVASDINIGRPTSYRNELLKTTGFQYDANGRLTRITAPEGNYVQYGYDARGNVTSTTNVAKSLSGLANIVTSASFDATCANVLKCNKPNSTTDAKANVTDYTYDATHGGLLTVTRPAPSTGATRPQTRLTYSQVTSAAGDLVYMPTKAAACQTLATCTNAADESQVLAAYNSNLLPFSSTRQNGTATLVSSSTLAYDARGNLITVDGPLAGAADTTRYRYDMADQLVGITSPDPDGTGALQPSALKFSYNDDGTLSMAQVGTVTDQSDTAWSSFLEQYRRSSAYDANARLIRQTLWSKGVDYAVSDYLYDNLGRPSCAITYMDPTQWGPQASSCAPLQTNGPDGPDRVSQTTYDEAGHVTSLLEGVGTADAGADRTITYTDNGLLASLKDGENNLTTYQYDGFDRLSKTIYPSATKGAGTSNSGDYEQLTYDLNSNVTSRRLRDATSIAFTFDKLDRVTLKDLPGAEADVSYSYDLLDRLTGATKGTYRLTLGYDALSRQVSDGQPFGTITRQFDAADRMTRTTWWDGFYVDYDRLATGQLSKVRENGALTGVGVLASYDYDSFGDRLKVTFGNGGSQTYGYDDVLRLRSLSVDLAGATSDLATNFTYNAASQIASISRDNDAYAWTGHGGGTTNYVANGLSQQLGIGSGTATWDLRGNLTFEPQSTKTYTYTSENKLASVSGGVTAYYDALNRLSEYNTSISTRFVSDGGELSAEVDNPAGAIQRRYVRGDAPDELIAWYEGSGTSNRRFASRDERGSILAWSDSGNGLVGINRFDEYGKPQSSNIGRMQYIGQPWFSEANAYDFKNRNYLPQIGGFGQTDPLGYQDALNSYAYVLDDPVNSLDPLGLATCHGNPDVCGHQRPQDTAASSGQPSAAGGASSERNGRAYPDRDDQSDKPECPTGSLNAEQLSQCQVTITAKKHKCPTSFAQFSIGPSINLSFLSPGASLGASLTISIPARGGWRRGGWRGIQLAISGQATRSLGLGAYAGAGLNIGVNPSGSLLSSGYTSSKYVEGEAAFGEGAGFSAAIPDNDLAQGSFSLPYVRPGIGMGAYFGVGRAWSATLASPPLGCS